MDRDPAVEIVNSENRKSICQLGPIQPTFDFPATVAGNGRRYRFQVSKWFCLYSVQPKVTLQVNFCFKYSNCIVGLRHYFIWCFVCDVFSPHHQLLPCFPYRLSMLHIVAFVSFCQSRLYTIKAAQVIEMLLGTDTGVSGVTIAVGGAKIPFRQRVGERELINALGEIESCKLNVQYYGNRLQ